MKRYTPEMKAFIEAHIKGRRYAELAELMSAHFGETFTAGQMHAYAQNHNIRNGMPCGKLAGEPSKQYPPEVAAFIRDNVTGTEMRALTRKINEHFGTSYSYNQIKAYTNNHNLRNGLDFRIKPGTPPPNKGRKGYHAPGSEKGWFKQGHAPHNSLPVGTEIVNGDGYLQVKTAEPDVWKRTHILNWENANGPVPEGCAVLFLDGDRMNTALENLTLVTRDELLELNRRGLIKNDAELTASGVLVARLRREIYKKRKIKKQGGTHE